MALCTEQSSSSWIGRECRRVAVSRDDQHSVLNKGDVTKRAGPLRHLQTFPGAACCHAAELTTLQSGSPPSVGPLRHLQTFPGAACSHTAELATLQSGSPPGALGHLILADTRPIALLSAFAAFRARSPRFLRSPRPRRITRSILRDLQGQ
jgi:hypothetical protein